MTLTKHNEITLRKYVEEYKAKSHPYNHAWSKLEELIGSPDFSEHDFGNEPQGSTEGHQGEVEYSEVEDVGIYL